MEYYIISFSNTHSAIAAEKHLKQHYKIVIMPTPREVSKGCGISIRFAADDLNGIVNCLSSISLSDELYDIHHYSGGKYLKYSPSIL